MELTDIVAWVFVWEAVDVLVFGSHELRTQKLRCLSFMDMKIEFYPPMAGGVPLAGTAEQSADQALGSK